MPAASRSSWHVYIVRCADRTLYTGVAKNLPARIAAHNDGRGAKYTRQRLAREARVLRRRPRIALPRSAASTR